MLSSGVDDVAGNIGLCLPKVLAEGSVGRSTARHGGRRRGTPHAVVVARGGVSEHRIRARFRHTF